MTPRILHIQTSDPVHWVYRLTNSTSASLYHALRQSVRIRICHADVKNTGSAVIKTSAGWLEFGMYELEDFKAYPVCCSQICKLDFLERVAVDAKDGS